MILSDDEVAGWADMIGTTVYNFARRDRTRRKPAGVPQELSWWLLTRDEKLACCRATLDEYGKSESDTDLSGTELGRAVIARIEEWIDIEIEDHTTRY